jgi:hypothetical protein
MPLRLPPSRVPASPLSTASFARAEGAPIHRVYKHGCYVASAQGCSKRSAALHYKPGGTSPDGKISIASALYRFVRIGSR